MSCKINIRESYYKTCLKTFNAMHPREILPGYQTGEFNIMQWIRVSAATDKTVRSQTAQIVVTAHAKKQIKEAFSGKSK